MKTVAQTVKALAMLVMALPLLFVAWALNALGHGSLAWLPGLNSMQVVDWLMQESLDVLVNKLSIAQHFNTQVQEEFNRDFAPGETVRVPFPYEYLIRNGLPYTEQPLNRRYTTVSCTNIFGIDFGWDSFEQALKLERSEDWLRKEFIETPMAQMAQEIENRCADWATKHTSNIVGVLGTDPTTFDASSAAARQRLVELGCPVGKDRCMVVPPSVMRAIKGSNVSYFNPVSDQTKMQRTGVVGFGDGFDWYESVSLYSHTAGTWGVAGVTVNGSPADGATSMTVNCTSGDTFLEGNVFSIASVNPTNPRTRRRVGSSARQFRVAADVTASAATATITFSPALYGPGSQYQNVDALPVNGAALTLFPGTNSPNAKAGTNGLAIGQDAFALVSVKFDNPEEGGNVKIARQLRDEETGIQIALLRMFDGVQRRWINRFDTCIGFGDLWSDNNAVRILGA